MPSTNHYKTLGQAYSTAAYSADLYTCSAATNPSNQAVSSTLTICNQTASQAKISVLKRVAGAATANKQYLIRDCSIDPGMTTLTVGWCFAVGDVLSISCDIAGVSFNLDGSEIY